MKGVYHMEVNDYDNLIQKQRYKVLLTLPSYVVIQHPKTFHTVLYAYKRHPRTAEWVRKYLNQYSIPGLASDVNVSIPAGMWQEWVKKTKNSNTETGSVDNYLIPPSPAAQQERYVDETTNVTTRTFISSPPFPSRWEIPNRMRTDITEAPTERIEED